MSPERFEELASRFLCGDPLTPEEERDLVQAIDSASALREDFLKDAILDGRLRGIARARQGQDHFSRLLNDCLKAERDGTRFIRKVESRLPEGTPTEAHAGATGVPRRRSRRGLGSRQGPGRAGLWAAGVAAAGIFVGAILILTLSPAGRVPSGEAETARLRAQREEQRRRESLARQEAAFRTRAERARLEGELARGEEERGRLAEDLKRAQDIKAQEEIKAREADLAKTAEAFKEKLRLAQEKERAAAEAVAQASREAPQEKTATLTSIAKVVKAVNAVLLTADGGREPVLAGQDLLAGQGLEVSAGGLARLEYPDQTRVELGAETEIRELRAEGGKRVFIVKGTVKAEVARQPAGQPMRFVMPHAESTVLGTTLRLLVDPDPKRGTRLEVEEGKVELKNLAGKTVVVESGHYAVAAEGTELLSKLLPKLLLAEDFEDARAVASRWLPVKDGFPVTSAGQLEIDISPKSADSYPSSWHEAGGLTSRVAFRIPFRLQVDVEVTHRHPNVIAAILFLPRPTRSQKEDLPITPWVCFRGDAMSVARDDGDNSPAVRTTGKFPRRDRWTVEVDLQEIRVFVNDRETVKYKHIRSVPSYFLFLNANAKLDAPRGARVRFDNLRVEELRR